MMVNLMTSGNRGFQRVSVVYGSVFLGTSQKYGFLCGLLSRYIR